MLSGDGLVHLVNVITPLYFAIALGYVSIKWNIISNDKFLPGVSGFTSKFALPFLCFRLLATNNPYSMNMRLILADSIFKCAVLLFGVLACFHRKAPDYVAWISSLYNLATLPNSVLIGIPLVTSLYPGTESYISTLIFMQIAIWFTVCIVILEIHKVLSEGSGDAVAVASTVPGTEGKHDGSVVEMEPNGCAISDGASKREEAPLTQMVTELDGAVLVTVDEVVAEQKQSGSNAVHVIVAKNAIHEQQRQRVDSGASLIVMAKKAIHEEGERSFDGDRAEISPSMNSSHEGFCAVRIATMCASALGPTPPTQSFHNQRVHDVTLAASDVVEGGNFNSSAAGGDVDSGRRMRKKGRNTTLQIIATVGKRAINELKWSPVLWASFLGLVYALFSFKFHKGVPLPDVLNRTTAMLGDCTLGLAMFMLGMSIASSKKLFACGLPLALMGAFLRFFIAPAVMALCSIAVGLSGDTFRFAVMQSMVPQAVVSFVFATQYQVHVDLFGTAVWFQTLIFLPFVIALDALLSVNS